MSTRILRNSAAAAAFLSMVVVSGCGSGSSPLEVLPDTDQSTGDSDTSGTDSSEGIATDTVILMIAMPVKLMLRVLMPVELIAAKRPQPIPEVTLMILPLKQKMKLIPEMLMPIQAGMCQ